MNISEQLAVSSITFRSEPLEKALQRIQQLGFSRMDLTAIRHYCDHFDPLLVDVGEEECARIRDLVASYGIQVISLTSYPANPLAKDLNGDDWVEGVDAYVRLGLYVGASHIIYPPGRPAPPADRWRGSAEHALPWLREAAQRTLTAQMTPTLALQSNSLLRTSRQGLDFLPLLRIPQVGLAVDPAHLAGMGEDPGDALRKMGSAVGYVVLRDTDGTNFNLPPGWGELDYDDILAALAEIDYRGPLVLAVDDITQTPEARADLIKRGRDFLLQTLGDREAA